MCGYEANEFFIRNGCAIEAETVDAHFLDARRWRQDGLEAASRDRALG
jgi:hypothetical protein